MNKVDQQHKDMIKRILSDGTRKMDRTGVGTLSLFGQQMRFNMLDGFPLLTLRKIHTKSFIHEMLWFIGAFDQNKYGKFGNTNIRVLLESGGVTFWTEWPYQKYCKSREYRPELPDFNIKEFEAKILLDDDFAIEFGSLGKAYGKQWLDYGGHIEKKSTVNKNDVSYETIFHPGINQIDNVINLLKKDPDSRRIILDAWKVDEIEDTLLPPCHMMFQLYSEKMKPEHRFHAYSKWISDNSLSYGEPMEKYNFPERRLSLQLYQRSCDFYLGSPFNVAEYALLLHMISQIVNMVPHELIIDYGDVHLYSNSIEAAEKIIGRTSYDLPIIKLNKDIKNIYDFRYEDIKIENYRSHSNIKVDVAV